MIGQRQYLVADTKEHPQELTITGFEHFLSLDCSTVVKHMTTRVESKWDPRRWIAMF